jgi:hypothetical protein
MSLNGLIEIHQIIYCAALRWDQNGGTKKFKLRIFGIAVAVLLWL